MSPRLVWFALALTVSAGFVATGSAWSGSHPPIGIPAPSFGIQAVPPPAPAQWPSREAANHYYVDNTQQAATDKANPYGYPDRPRMSIPTYLSAGAYVEIRGGPYRGRQLIITAEGTADHPVWIRGAGPTRPVIQRETILKGRYVIVEYLHHNSTLSPRLHNGASIQYAVIRNCEFVGPGVNAGSHSVIGIGGGPGAIASHIVVYNNVIHGYGDASPSSPENDFHGVAPHAFVTDVWILNNHIHHLGGDAVQVGAAKIPADARPQRIYIGGNTFHTNRENAVDIKAANDVIVSQNTMHGARRTSSSAGEVVVIHNGADHVWILFNRISDGEIGLITTGSTHTYVIGNLISNIHGQPQPSLANAAIGFRGGSTLTAVNNTIHDVDTGIQVSRGQNAIMLTNNLIANVTAPFYHIHIDGTAAATGSRLQSSLLYQNAGPVRVHWGESARSAKDACSDCTEGDPRFVDAAGGDFRLGPGSSAIDRGGVSSAYMEFSTRYSLSIATDISGVTRPQGSHWDIGAHETEGAVDAATNPVRSGAQN